MTLEVGDLTEKDPGDKSKTPLPPWTDKSMYSTRLTLKGSAAQTAGFLLTEGADSYNVLNDGKDDQFKIYRSGLRHANGAAFVDPVFAIDGKGTDKTTLKVLPDHFASL